MMTNENAVTMKDGQPMLTMMRGKTTFLIGMHFNEKSKDTIDDKIKKIIRKENVSMRVFVQNGKTR